MTPRILALDHLVLTVRDIDRAVEFYCSVLGMRHEVFQPADGTTRHALSFGTQKINLHRSGAEFEPKARHPAPGSADLCFLTDVPLAEWKSHLSSAGVTVEAGPVQRTGATGPILSLYLRDPDDNLIEIGIPLDDA